MAVCRRGVEDYDEARFACFACYRHTFGENRRASCDTIACINGFQYGGAQITLHVTDSGSLCC